MSFYGINFSPNLVGVLDTKPVSEEILQDRLRHFRNELLAATDWTQMIDASADQDAWALYRQQLRDLPKNVKDITDVTWPEPPK